MKKIRKAVFPVAGLGTRFLPATKSVPKEMMTVVDRPVLQHVVDEAREAGIEHFVFVTGRNKAVIEDHFDMSYELEDTLKRRGKDKEYQALMADLPKAGTASFTRQQAPLGLGHAVWCAREIIGDEPFAVLLPDMITLPGKRGDRCLAQCIETYERYGGNVIAVEEVPMDQTHQYGIVSIGSDKGADFEITAMVEKPPMGKPMTPAPSSASSAPTSPSRSRAPTSPTTSRPNSAGSSARSRAHSSGCSRRLSRTLFHPGIALQYNLSRLGGHAGFGDPPPWTRFPSPF